VWLSVPTPYPLPRRSLPGKRLYFLVHSPRCTPLALVSVWMSVVIPALCLRQEKVLVKCSEENCLMQKSFSSGFAHRWYRCNTQTDGREKARYEAIGAQDTQVRMDLNSGFNNSTTQCVVHQWYLVKTPFWGMKPLAQSQSPGVDTLSDETVDGLPITPVLDEMTRIAALVEALNGGGVRRFDRYRRTRGGLCTLNNTNVAIRCHIRFQSGPLFQEVEFRHMAVIRKDGRAVRRHNRSGREGRDCGVQKRGRWLIHHRYLLSTSPPSGSTQ
jgi:hypothetical protein